MFSYYVTSLNSPIFCNKSWHRELCECLMLPKVYNSEWKLMIRKLWGNNSWKKKTCQASLCTSFWGYCCCVFFRSQFVSYLVSDAHASAHVYPHCGLIWRDKACENYNSQLDDHFVSVMNNTLPNQLEKRKPIAIKTWLDSYQAMTTVPGPWLKETQTVWLYILVIIC